MALTGRRPPLNPAPWLPACVRGADWRFLLPSPPGGAFDHAIVIGGAPELQDMLVEIGAAHHVSSSTRDGRRADAVIALAGAAESLEGLARALPEGGVVYWEVDRRSAGWFGLTPARAVHRLVRAGLTPTGAYWIKPGFPSRDMYLPIDARAAFRWYLETLYRAPTLRRRALKGLLRAVATSESGLSACAPCYAVTAIRGTPRLPAIIERARTAGAVAGAQAHAVLLAHGEAAWNRLVLLLFEPDQSSPSCVIKAPRLSTFNRHVEWEHEVLRELRSTLPPALRRSIPSSTLFRWKDLTVVAESCVTGSSLNSRIRSATAEVLDDLRLTADWLASFHRETTVERVPAGEWLTRRLVDGICSEYAAIFGLTAAEAHLFAAVSRYVESCGGSTLPLAWQHTDFGPWNIYRDGRGLRVIDWEIARLGPVLADLLYFATHWGAAVAGHTDETGRAAHVASLFCTGAASPLAAALRTEIARYTDSVGVAQALVPCLLVYTFVEQAVDRARRLGAAHQPHAAERATNPYVGYLAAVGRHADALFAGETRYAA